ncbi:MAG: xylulokinase [Bacteroidota bacterium]|nr:xylulokinase [Bacteroidota bacterium]
MAGCVIGVDVSTTASKVLAVSLQGDIIGLASSPHHISSPAPLWSEQDPAQWWDATCHSIRRLLAEQNLAPDSVKAVGLTGQMHGLVLLDAAGEVLRPAMLWNDGRSTRQCEHIRSTLGLDRLVSLTGNDAFTGFTAPKLLWVRDHEPNIFAATRQVLLPKDYIRYRLTGEYATDKAGAGGTLLLGLKVRDWDETILEALDIPKAWLPDTYEGPQITGTLSRKAATATGLNIGTPVAAGAGDQAAQAVGTGAIMPDLWTITLGTSGVVFASCAAPYCDPNGSAHAFPHALPGVWHMMGVMLSAAGSLQWYRDTIAFDRSFDALLNEVGGIEAGSDGLLFLPYLTGERTPHADPLAQGAFVGFTPRHSRGHLTRAVLEGVAFGLRDNFGLLQQAGLPPPHEVRISGGGARSGLWRQIIADVLRTELVMVEVPEGAAMGAAILAGVGSSCWESVESACHAIVSPQEITHPGPEADQYADPYEAFTALYRQLKPFFALRS